MSSILQQHGPDLSAAATELIDGARDAGGPDNITVILVRVSDDELEKTTYLPLGHLEVDPPSRRVGNLLSITLFLSFAAGVLLTLWIVQQGTPTVSQREAAGAELRQLLEQYEDARMPQTHKNRIVARMRAILEDVELLEEEKEEE